MQKKDRAKFIQNYLEKLYPNTPIPLSHANIFELLIAVLLSAQCTDERVNKVTPILFNKANSPEKMLELDIETIYSIVRPCGLAPQKSKAISAKKTNKKTQIKSIKNKSTADESNIHDEVKIEKTVKSQSESILSSGTKSKNLKKEGTTAKITPQKSKKTAPRNKEKVNTSKSIQVTKPRNKTVKKTES